MAYLVEIAAGGVTVGQCRCLDEAGAHAVRHQAALDLSHFSMMETKRPRRDFRPLKFIGWHLGKRCEYALTVRELAEGDMTGSAPNPARTWKSWYRGAERREETP